MFSEGDKVQWECEEGLMLQGTILKRLTYNECIFYKIETDKPGEIRWVDENNLTNIYIKL